MAFVVALVNVTAVPLAAPVVQPLKVPLNEPLVTIFPVRPFERPPKALATAPAKMEPLAVRVRPPIVIDSPATKSLNVATALSVAAAAAPSVFTNVGLTASVPVFHLPLVLDMVRDSVKNRLLNVLGFACIFCSVILILASFIFVAPLDAIPNKVC